MKRSALVALIGVMMVCATITSGLSDSLAAEKEGRVLRHIVMYKFKDDCPAEHVQKVIDTFAGLPRKIDTIIGFEHGKNVSQEGKSEGLTYCFQVTFRDQQGLATYLKHPAHDEYVKVVGPCREKVVVFDYWADRSK